MTTSDPCSVETLGRCFLSAEEIPPAFRLGPCREERFYLLDGQIRTWEGTLAEVSSPICLRQPDGTLRLRSILSLDAKNPALVMADADLEVAVREVVTGALSFNGQRCTGLKLTFVHASIVDAFLEKLSQAVNALAFGLPWDQSVKLTPMPEFDKVGAMQALVDDAVSKGAKVVNAAIRSLVAAQSNPESRDIIQEIVTRRHSNFLRTDYIL